MTTKHRTCFRSDQIDVNFIVCTLASDIHATLVIATGPRMKRVSAGVIIGYGNHRSWDPRAPMMGKYFYFQNKLRHPDDVYPRGSTHMMWVLAWIVSCHVINRP